MSTPVLARFDGRSIVITGGAGGLGGAIARAFVAERAHVTITDVDVTAGESLARELGPAAEFRALDVTDEAQWEAVLDDAVRRRGALDVLVNNAGFFRPNVPFEDMPLDLWRRHFAVNADGTFLGCKHAIRRMKATGGAIVNVASGMGVSSRPTASAYCASKAAVLMTTRTAAGAAGRHGIRVNAVLPGAVDTAMLAGNLQPGEDKAEFLERLRGFGALGRLASPQDIARAVLFLADPANATLSGASLSVDGGNVPGG
jgi:NAD(P)-dependent dehydrogenase (short-subunit alcohol dehydrogenase family)